jgi:hypothetical membrane protein
MQRTALRPPLMLNVKGQNQRRTMNLSRVFVIAGLLLGCALQIHCTFGRGLSTPEERSKAINIARLLERDPLARDAPANRQWLLNWIIEVPDVHFKSCVGLLNPGVGNQYRYSTEVNQQIIFSSAAFRLEHPDHLRNDTGANIAGVEGALRVYEILLKSAPDAKLAFLDDLVARRDHGDLADHVSKVANEKCKRSKVELIMPLTGAGVGLVLGLFVAQWLGRCRVSRVAGLGSVTPGYGSTRFVTIIQPVVFLCVAYFVIVLIVLHILEPEFDPRFRFMSEYALGDYGWLMTTTFFVLGLAAFAVAAGLQHIYPSSRSARIGIGLLAVGALFICLAGIFKDSLPHLLASVVVFPSIVMAVLLLSWTFRQTAGWQTIYRVSVFIALGMLATFFSMVADVGMPGLQQRVFIFLFLLWLSIVVHRLVRVTGAA